MSDGEREVVEIVIVGGLSGSGRSTAMAALEDLKFYAVDNLPPPLVMQFLDLCRKAKPPIHKIALAVDTREEHFLHEIPQVVAELRDRGVALDVIFLDCSDEVLVNRYRETRRVHPLSPDGSAADGIRRERELLAEIAAIADYAIDTTGLNVHQLRDTVVQHVSGEKTGTVVNLMSFGFRYGPPSTCELLFDVRFLENPYWDASLRALSGRDASVAEYVLANDRGEQLLHKLRDLLGFTLPLYDEEGKAYLGVAIGCTGGRHRSVAVVEALGESLRAAGREVNVEHRDIERGG